MRNIEITPQKLSVISELDAFKASWARCISAIAIIAILSMPTKTQAAKESSERYEERKLEEQQFIKGVQDEHEEAVEKKIEESEKPKEHIIHKKDSTSRKNTEKSHHHDERK